jgi:hypothetical protein
LPPSFGSVRSGSSGVQKRHAPDGMDQQMEMNKAFYDSMNSGMMDLSVHTAVGIGEQLPSAEGNSNNGTIFCQSTFFILKFFFSAKFQITV